MTCPQIREWLGPYLDGEAPGEVARQVEAHLATCPSCADELSALRDIAERLAGLESARVPPQLWTTIEHRLPAGRQGQYARGGWHARWGRFGRSLWRGQKGAYGRLARYPGQRRAPLVRAARVWIAAALAFAAVGLGLLTRPWGRHELGQARAATVDFSPILDGLKQDPVAAFSAFLERYEARLVTAEEAVDCGCGCGLDVDLPETLPGGFRRQAAYTLRFGASMGVAARYARDEELLGVVFHPPVLQEQFGTHEDRSCVIGPHRGQAVRVGDWSLVHLTDATTCHCVLSRLDPQRELPAVMAAIAPRRADRAPHGDRPGGGAP